MKIGDLKPNGRENGNYLWKVRHSRLLPEKNSLVAMAAPKPGLTSWSFLQVVVRVLFGELSNVSDAGKDDLDQVGPREDTAVFPIEDIHTVKSPHTHMQIWKSFTF